MFCFGFGGVFGRRPLVAFDVEELQGVELADDFGSARFVIVDQGQVCAAGRLDLGFRLFQVDEFDLIGAGLAE